MPAKNSLNGLLWRQCRVRSFLTGKAGYGMFTVVFMARKPASNTRRKLKRSLNRKSSMRRKVIPFLALLTALGAASGCQHVKPWQRGDLADPIMRSDRDP